MMATYFERTSLARVKFPPNKPSIVARCMSVLACMMHSYDLFHKPIRQARFSVVTALCEVYHLLN